MSSLIEHSHIEIAIVENFALAAFATSLLNFHEQDVSPCSGRHEAGTMLGILSPTAANRESPGQSRACTTRQVCTLPRSRDGTESPCILTTSLATKLQACEHSGGLTPRRSYDLDHRRIWILDWRAGVAW
jgi:hypothetical protein